MQLDLSALLPYLERGGVLGILVLIVVTGMKQVWVWGWQYRQAVAEREEWKARWIKAAELAEKSVRK